MFAWSHVTSCTLLKHGYVIYISKCVGYLILGYIHFHPGMYSIVIIKAAIF